MVGEQVEESFSFGNGERTRDCLRVTRWGRGGGRKEKKVGGLAKKERDRKRRRHEREKQTEQRRRLENARWGDGEPSNGTRNSDNAADVFRQLIQIPVGSGVEKSRRPLFTFHLYVSSTRTCMCVFVRISTILRHYPCTRVLLVIFQSLLVGHKQVIAPNLCIESK